MTHRRLGGIGRRDDRGALKGRVSRPVPRTRGVGGTLAPPLTGGAAGPMFLRTSPYPPRTFLKTDRVTAFRPARTGARPRPRSCRRRREDPSQHRPRSRALEEGVGGDVHRGEAHPVDAYGPRRGFGDITRWVRTWPRNALREPVEKPEAWGRALSTPVSRTRCLVIASTSTVTTATKRLADRPPSR